MFFKKRINIHHVYPGTSMEQLQKIIYRCKGRDEIHLYGGTYELSGSLLIPRNVTTVILGTIKFT